ncbi:MAG: hypothetical protein JWM76_3005 [Pseudonocardiales bacterium]|jgi:hypothetical protein|nr:hypothetical protein [Pseudonocardiales bacterium]
MTSLPHDLSDTYLAPLVLNVDARLRELADLGFEELLLIVEGTVDHPVVYRSFREEALMTAISEPIALHGWILSWDPRGLRISHDERSLVLGLPATLIRYLDGSRA